MSDLHSSPSARLRGSRSTWVVVGLVVVAMVLAGCRPAPSRKRSSSPARSNAVVAAAPAQSGALGGPAAPVATSTTTMTPATSIPTPTSAPPTSGPPTTTQPGPPTTTQPGTSSTTSTTTTQVHATSWRLASQPNSIAGCQIFDRTSVMHSLATGLPVHPRSQEFIEELGVSSPLTYDIRLWLWEGSRPGRPINIVDSSQVPHVPIVYHQDVQDRHRVPTMPIPPDPRIEGDPTPEGDMHLILVDRATCEMYELISYNRMWYRLLGIHWAAAGAVWHLGAGEGLKIQAGTTVGDLPMVGLMVRLEEVQDGLVDHPIAACSSLVGRGRVWPATHSDGPNLSPSAPPMGARLRLKADRVASFSGQARVIVEAMRTHGVLLADSCGKPLTISAENVASGWDMTSIDTLANLTIGDFEVVDQTPMIISADSWQVR